MDTLLQYLYNFPVTGKFINTGASLSRGEGWGGGGEGWGVGERGGGKEGNRETEQNSNGNDLCEVDMHQLSIYLQTNKTRSMHTYLYLYSTAYITPTSVSLR